LLEPRLLEKAVVSAVGVADGAWGSRRRWSPQCRAWGPHCCADIRASFLRAKN